MIYCLPVFGNIWLQGDEQLRFRSFKKEDLRRLQVLQNRVLRLLTDLPYNTSTEMLVKKSNTMSIHQLTAYHSLLMTHKITVSKKPEYLSKKLVLKTPEDGRRFPHRQAYTFNLAGNLSTVGSQLSTGNLPFLQNSSKQCECECVSTDQGDKQ